MPVISEVGHRCTIAEFEQFLKHPDNRERRFELIDGAIVERVRSEENELIVANFALYVGRFVIKRGLGRIVLDTYHHAPNDEYNDLLPDIALTRKERLQPVVSKGAVPQIPDLVIEVPARGACAEDFQAKVQYYLAYGAALVWLAHPAACSIAVCTQNKVRLLRKDGVLDGGNLLPGFSLPVRDIFDFD